MLHDALGKSDVNGFLGYADMLNTMLLQHNLKEENVLYLMADRVLSGQQNEIINSMNSINTTL
jgi:hemerythrin-like domain-containing protein